MREIVLLVVLSVSVITTNLAFAESKDDSAMGRAPVGGVVCGDDYLDVAAVTTGRNVEKMDNWGVGVNIRNNTNGVALIFHGVENLVAALSAARTLDASSTPYLSIMTSVERGGLAVLGESSGSSRKIMLRVGRVTTMPVDDKCLINLENLLKQADAKAREIVSRPR